MPTFDAKTKRTRAEALVAALESERSTFDAHWRDLADVFTPRRSRWTSSDRNKGDKRNQNIINSTTRFAARTLQSGLHAGLTSPARPWMRLTLLNPQMMASAGVREWLYGVTQSMLTLFQLSNLYNVLPIVYGDMGVFGTGAMAVLEDPDEVFRCYAYPVGSYVLGYDHRQRLNTFARKYELSTRQVVEEFATKPDGSIDWSRVSATVKRNWDQGQYEAAVELCWTITPNLDADPQKAEARFLPWASLHWETGASDPVFLRESGFRMFPVMAPRWDVTGEDSYATDCPGMTALGDARQLQIMERRKGQAISKLIDPPLIGPTALRQQKTSLLPGDITYIDVREGMQGLRAIHEVGLNLQHLGFDLQAVEYRIKRAFFEDLFLMLATTDPYRGSAPPTAREIDERHEEKLLALGPVLERTNDELLDPLIDRVFNIMDDQGLLPPPPPEIQGAKLKPEYISILSQAQKLVGVVAQDRFLQVVVPTIEAFPEIRAKVNIFEMVDNYAEMLGIDPAVVRSTEEAEQITAEQAQAVQQQAGAEQAVQLAQTAKLASETQMDQDSALDRLVAAAGAAPPR